MADADETAISDRLEIKSIVILATLEPHYVAREECFTLPEGCLFTKSLFADGKN